MLLLVRSGQRGAALAQFESCRRLLKEELGVEPGPDTVALYERIRDGALESAPQDVRPSSPVSVDKGRVLTQLEPLDFGVEVSRHTESFCGREWLFAELEEWLRSRSSRVWPSTSS